MSTVYPCPCCQKDFTPSVSAETAEKDSMQNMFDCPHCQSVLKWEQNAIKVIRKADPEEPQKLDLPEEAAPQSSADPITDTEPDSNEFATEPADTEQDLNESNEPTPLQTEQQSVSEPTEPLDNPSDIEQPISEPLDNPADTEQPVNETNEPIPLHTEQQPVNEPNEPLADPLDNPADTEQPVNEPTAELSGMKQPPSESGKSISKENTNTQFEFNEAHPEEELEQAHTNISATPESVEKKEPPAAASSSASQANFNLSNEEELVVSPNTSENFSDIESYGNSEDNLDKGFLHYDIIIQGIDSKKIEQKVLSILEEPRFNWMAKEILSLQKDGVLIIKKLNPVKAMRLISELSFLPVTLSWKQYMAITELQPETTTGEQPPEEDTPDNPEEDTQD